MKSPMAFSASVVFLLFCLPAAAQRRSQPPQHKAASPQSGAAAEISEGERVFHQNCARCHNAPEDLSPRVVPAVIRQMRVRAMLSEQQERALLKFLAP